MPANFYFHSSREALLRRYMYCLNMPAHCCPDGGEEKNSSGNSRGVRQAAEGKRREETATKNQPQGFLTLASVSVAQQVL